MSEMLFFFKNLNIFNVFILSKLISTALFFGKILGRFSIIPPPVILQHPLIKPLVCSFNTSLT